MTTYSALDEQSGSRATRSAPPPRRSACGFRDVEVLDLECRFFRFYRMR